MTTTSELADPQQALLQERDAPAGSARERIFEAARRLFYRQGIRAVGVELIAAEANTTKMTLYRHFASKDELLVECLRDQDRCFWRWWDSVVAPLEGRPREQIKALFSSFKSMACCDERERGCPIANAAVEIVEDDHPAKEIVRVHHEQILRRLHTMCRAMGARKPKELADALMLLMGGAFLSRLVFDQPGPVVSVAEVADDLLDSPTLGVCPSNLSVSEGVGN